MIPLSYNPQGMTCVESVEEAARGVADKLRDMPIVDGFTAAVCVARLENALEREAERREPCTTIPT
ncbi:hypothetical protein [Maridesulfovibrio sp.]|uniref:hypothetical protein n=1 Tax=Maridesulfovibrio sp. TaxID=2795000 RepID=UPI0029CA3B4E|nr:hypothetical protein [Maridesulfovibrio sp.]